LNEGTPKSAGMNGAMEVKPSGAAAPSVTVTRFTTPVPVGCAACVPGHEVGSHVLTMLVLSPGASGLPAHAPLP
jgi:hypothetical protein